MGIHRSSYSQVRRTLIAGASGMLAASVAGCARDVAAPSEAVARIGSRTVTAVQPASASARARAAIEAAVQGKSARAFEDEILRLENDLPEVGGAYWTEDGSAFVVHLTDASAEPRLRAVMARQVPTWRLPPEMRHATLTKLRVVRGRYAFSRLVAWQQMLTADADARELLLGVDADEKANRVSVTVEAEEAVQRLTTAGTRLGIPLSALLVRVGPATHTVSSVRAPYRPMGGGTGILNTAQSILCTLGWNVVNASTLAHGFLTAGHCVIPKGQGGNIGVGFYQGSTFSDGPTAGTVNLNPPWNSSDPACSGYSLCTNADVIFVQNTGLVGDAHKVARTSYFGFGDGPGSITLQGWFSTVRAAEYAVITGPIADKVGRLTGWTAGYITETCANLPVDGAMNLCVHRVGARAGQGDSGGPVFFRNVDGSITPFGVVFAASWTTYATDPTQGNAKYCTSGCSFVFSDFPRIALHLGTAFYPESY